MAKLLSALLAATAMMAANDSALSAGEPGVTAPAQHREAASPGLLVTRRMSALLAMEAVVEAVKNCALQGHHVTAVVVDSDGVIQAQLRGDGASVHTLDSAYYKAYTAVSYLPIHPDLTKTSEMSKDGPVNLWAKIPRLLQGGGGLLIRAAGEVVGAIGVGGGPGAQFDEGCGQAGIDLIRDRLR